MHSSTTKINELRCSAKMREMLESCNEASLFFSGIFSYFSLALALELWPDDEKARQIHASYASHNHDEIVFYQSLAESEQQDLIAWYNRMMKETVTPDLRPFYPPTLTVEKERIDRACQLFDMMRQKHEEMGQFLFPDKLEYAAERWQNFSNKTWSYYRNLDGDKQLALVIWYHSQLQLAKVAAGS